MHQLRKFTPAGAGVTVNALFPTTGNVMQFDNFNPGVGGSQSVPVVQTQKSAAVRIANLGPAAALVDLVGPNTQPSNPATGFSGFLLFAGASEVFSTGAATWIAARGVGGNAQLYATPGEGI